jgi:hypothetical protein
MTYIRWLLPLVVTVFIAGDQTQGLQVSWLLSKYIIDSEGFDLKLKDFLRLVVFV